MIDGRNVFDQIIKNDLRKYNIIQKFATGQDDDCKTECLLDYPCFKEYYNLIDIDLSEQQKQKLDADPKAIQQINFTGNLNRAESATMFFITEELNKTVLDFTKEIVKAL